MSAAHQLHPAHCHSCGAGIANTSGRGVFVMLHVVLTCACALCLCVIAADCWCQVSAHWLCCFHICLAFSFVPHCLHTYACTHKIVP